MNQKLEEMDGEHMMSLSAGLFFGGKKGDTSKPSQEKPAVTQPAVPKE